MKRIESIADLVDYLKGVEGQGLMGKRDGVRYYYRGEAEDYGDTGAIPGIVC